VVVMDNLTVHKSLAARGLVEAAGATVLFAPTYSPEYNPIELWWTDLKRVLRRHAAERPCAARGAGSAGAAQQISQVARAPQVTTDPVGPPCLRCEQCYHRRMTKRLQAIGNSAGIIIDKPILELLGITPETELELSTDGQRLIITPVSEKSRRDRVARLQERVLAAHEKTFRKLAK
jgi:antitoxin MazE